jgi:hypothetical protein
VGVILSGTVAVGGRIMKMTREQLFAAPKIARRAEDRLERGKAAVSAARARATEIVHHSPAQPRLRPNALQRRRLARLIGWGSAQP